MCVKRCDERVLARLELRADAGQTLVKLAGIAVLGDGGMRDRETLVVGSAPYIRGGLPGWLVQEYKY